MGWDGWEESWEQARDLLVGVIEGQGLSGDFPPANCVLLVRFG